MAFFTFNISFAVFLILASAIATCLSGPTQDLLSGQQSQECVHHHFSALLRLKHGFRFTYFSHTNLSSWNPENRDCCAWEGITCDTSTGHVISLDLGELGISGQIDFQSLSHLRSLQILNLADNSFDPSPIPPAIGQLNRLTHLNFSWGNFHGHIPSEMSSLTRLVSLDLSFTEYYNDEVFNFATLKLEKPSIGALIQNMSSLRELMLDGVDMSTGGTQWSEAICSALPNLRKLSMVDCGLSGPIHPYFFHLPFLSQLHLSYNSLSFAEFEFIGNLSSLTSLGLRGLHGKVSDKISRLSHLSELDLSSNDMSPAVLNFIGNLSSLASLSLSYCGLDGRYLDKILRLPCLTELHLSGNNFSSVKAHFFGNFSSFKSLTQLRLRNCSMSGSLPTQLRNFTRLESLDLSDNSFGGSIPSSYGNELLNLKGIYLSNNLLNGTIPSSLFSLPSLLSLSLWNNQLGGHLNEFHNASSLPLESIDLGKNKLQGMIPRSIFQLRNLNSIYLNSNNFTDALDLSLFLKQTKLSVLVLSNINLLVKEGISNSTFISFPQLSWLSLTYCNIQRFPEFLRNQRRLWYLDLSGNQMDGEIPMWIWNVGNGSLSHLNLSHNGLQAIQKPTPNLSSSMLSILDLSSNVLEGLLPIPSSALDFYSVSNNSLSGEIPTSICNLKYLELLDISNNNFSGRVPQCVGEMADVLAMLNLQGNAFNGSLLQTFKQNCSLKILDFSENQIEGRLPMSIANCKGLMILNLKSNKICDTFPWWVQGLTELRIFILGSNNFYGPIKLPQKRQNFSSKLQIIDLSSNKFNGGLPSTMFWGWKEMTGEDDSQPEYLGEIFASGLLYCGLFCETVVITSKSVEMALTKIRTDHTVLDLSNNHFQGQIPESIGLLKLLHVLNISHNRFTGQIPASLKNLRMLESLDLSQNNISGHIPQGLLELTFLEVLNLSGNQLIGSIPHGKQFWTFTDQSFKGNPGLCGLPLSKQCRGPDDATPSITTEAESLPESEYNWKMVALGFGIGYGVGMGVFCWTLVLWTKGRRTYNKYVNRLLLMLFPSAM